MQPTSRGLQVFWQKYQLRLILGAYMLISVVAACQGYFAGPKVYVAGVRPYTDFNNYIIFKNSFFHLIQGKDLYQAFPSDHWDFYKYSPAFALSFGLLAWMPDLAGLICWNLANSICLFAGVYLLPRTDKAKRTWILLFCLLELLTSLQNSQSNGLMAGLIILGFAFAERSGYFVAALCIALSFYVKIYGGLAFLLFLFYPEGRWKLFGWSFFWMVVFAVLPLAVINAHQLAFLYKSWKNTVTADHSAVIGISFMGLLGSIFKSAIPKDWIALTGFILFLLPLIHIRQYRAYSYRVLYLASTLIFLVVFNHRSESATFIIAMSGIAIWYFSQSSRGGTQDPAKSAGVARNLDLIFLTLSFLLVTMSVSDLVPAVVRRDIVNPYAIKALMPSLVWFRILYQQLFLRYRADDLAYISSPGNSLAGARV
jgi:hypothetical protein